MRKCALLLVVAVLAISAFAGGWKWKPGRAGTAAPAATLIAAAGTAGWSWGDGWSWGEDSA